MSAPGGLQVLVFRWNSANLGVRSIRTRLIAISVNMRATINLYIYIYKSIYIYICIWTPTMDSGCYFLTGVSRFYLTDSTPSAPARLLGKRFQALYYPRWIFALIYATGRNDAWQEHAFARTWDNWISPSDTFHLYARLIANGSIKREPLYLWSNEYAYTWCNQSQFRINNRLLIAQFINFIDSYIKRSNKSRRCYLW